MNEIVGEKIKNLRKSRNLSQEEVAESLHVSQSTYARIESGASNSWAGYILPLCELFNNTTRRTPQNRPYRYQ